MIINEQVAVELTEAEREAQAIKELEAETNKEPNEKVNEVENEIVVEEEIKPYLEDRDGNRYEFKPASRNLYKVLTKYINGKVDTDKIEIAVGKIMYAQHGMKVEEYNKLLDYLCETDGAGNVGFLLAGIFNEVLMGKKSKNKYVEQAKAKLV